MIFLCENFQRFDETVHYYFCKTPNINSQDVGSSDVVLSAILINVTSVEM